MSSQLWACLCHLSRLLFPREFPLDWRSGHVTWRVVSLWPSDAILERSSRLPKMRPSLNFKLFWRTSTPISSESQFLRMSASRPSSPYPTRPLSSTPGILCPNWKSSYPRFLMRLSLPVGTCITDVFLGAFRSLLGLQPRLTGPWANLGLFSIRAFMTCKFEEVRHWFSPAGDIWAAPGGFGNQRCLGPYHAILT